MEGKEEEVNRERDLPAIVNTAQSMGGTDGENPNEVLYNC